jgi:Na+/proline symporter
MIYFLVAYLLFQFSLGYWASRSVKNESDYLLAGRHVPTWLVSFSLFATWFGAETCIGTSGEVYSLGLSGARADPFGYTLCLLLLGLLIAKKIWNKKYSTLADFYLNRFGADVEKLSSLILIVSSLVWGAAQIRAMGQVISATTHFSSEITTLVSFLIVLSYCLMGGLLGDILTDFVQGLLLALGLSMIFYFVLKNEGFEIMMNQPSERLSLLTADETWWQRLDRWSIPILGSLIAQESISRLFATKSPKAAQGAALSAAMIYLVLGSIPVLLGLVGPTLLPGVIDKEHFLIALSEKYLPPFAQMLLIGALLSAILSAINSIMLATGGLFSHNLLSVILPKTYSKNPLRMTRISVFILAFVIYAIAHFSDGIYELVELASSFGSAGLVVITLLGLWTNLGNAKIALWTLIAGVASPIIFQYFYPTEAPFLISLGLCLILFLGLSVKYANASTAN